MVRRVLGDLTYIAICLLPWPARRAALNRAYGYEIDRTAFIGRSWVRPRSLRMGPGTRIGHLTMCKGIDLLAMEAHSRIGNGNWISGFPRSERKHFAHVTDRAPELQLGEHAAITCWHRIDATDRIRIGAFTTVAGYATQMLTHSIDLAACRQSCRPIDIGAYAFVGTNCVLLGGSALPDHSVLGAKSVLNKAHTVDHALYAGVPARWVKELSPDLGYFCRTRGFVD